MEGMVDVDTDTKKRGKKNVKKTGQCRKKKAQSVTVDGESLLGSAEGQNDNDPPGPTVSLFDYSLENHFKAIDKICRLCREAECDDLDKTEIDRLSSSITFVREWRHFNYQPRVIRFSRQNEISPQGKDVIGGITLPQFSAATVPKNDGQNVYMLSQEPSKDFVMYVGGHVWALDWCPRVHQRSESSNCDIACEFVAVAAHPPESSYHKIGAPLIGRGIIQIWSLLNVGVKEEIPQMEKKPKQKNPTNISTKKVEVKVDTPQPKNSRGRPPQKPVNESIDHLYGKVNSPEPKRPRGRPRKKPLNESVDQLSGKVNSPEPKRPRGRLRKKPVNEFEDNLDCNKEYMQALAVQCSENASNLSPVDMSAVSINTEHVSKNDSGRKLKACRRGDNLVLTSSVKKRRLKDKARTENSTDCDGLPLLTQNDNRESSPVNPNTCLTSGTDPVESSNASCFIPKDVALPRVVLCLAHNGKVAWDVKWRPSNGYDTESKHRMGYLAVLLGNGALEVWEVPLPQTMKVIYSSHQVEETDPRFVKLEPIFRCSKLKYGDRQSIPLTVEWSASSPHDFLLAGCHDGVVALWKFSANGTSKDTRPLLCFSADTVPIRAVAWAPVESSPESTNVIVTAGHKGLKFWDIRDPFRPLWDLNPVQRNIYSLDWLPDPRCVIVSFDDGTLRILSLVKAAYDVPVTGKPFVGTQQQGFHSYYCSSFAIWSVQVSRQTGMVAYCSADGTVLRFQLTERTVEKDPLRNRAPHFLCGSVTEEESTITINTPLPDTPFPMKKSLNEWSNAPRTIRGFLSESNQAKRAKEQIAKGQSLDSQPLALCYSDDPGTEIGSESPALQKSKQVSKSKTNSKKKQKADQALGCRDEEPEDTEKGDGENGGVGVEIEVLPPKIVAMHRVRWNMNKGSERWLCYGGAAGIVRCQEINKPARVK
ncbi:General transcription factor 3C polypeptide like [Actinidia chinensis var. chinensis]|uniref:General transcription factor 3C polypeptide like n=1 Tax=Actinidia chinensis var. chinensis TaxID=1590841 RepID=A0A2R6R7T4_ACTCC|nr:General transcription factor 3C polypeptide like [Actinidia chinensis var. chinensis]